MALTIDATTGTHIGDRKEQQDRVAIIPSKRVKGTALVVLADGAGGYTGGAAAASQVVTTATNLFENFSPKDESPEQLLREIVVEAHTVIKLNRLLTEEEPHSTFVALLLQPDRVDWGHVGDSRLYHFRGAELMHRTPDHSLVEQLTREGQIKEEDRHNHPNRNLLLQALGQSEVPEPTFGSSTPLADGDTFLLCSDGLWDYFPDAELAKILSTLPPRKAAEMLVTGARGRANGKGDNLTLALVKLAEAPVQAKPVADDWRTQAPPLPAR
ncbi:MAG: protein phosphatase 2C domain-containing protein [Betaproteobacteria bacterium]|nr:protein phosphatase 2C domain-containing protein [Betaproteobacteria bacterium]